MNITKRERSGAGALTAALLLGAATNSQAAPAADYVLRNGFVYTADATDSVAQAVAVRAGRIVYVGGNSGAGAFVGSGTKVLDLKGRMVMPGLRGDAEAAASRKVLRAAKQLADRA